MPVERSRKYAQAESLHECTVCGLQYWWPLHNPGREWYEAENAYELSLAISAKIRKGYHRKFLSRLPELPIQGNGPILDLGCGAGELVAELRSRGFEAWGVDFDERAIGLAQERAGPGHLHAQSIDDFCELPGLPAFQLVTFFEVLEHVAHPLSLLRRARSLIAPGGRVILSTPNRQRYLPDLAPWDHPPHHLTRWNPEALKAVSSRAGLDLVRVDFVDEFGHLAAAINEASRVEFVSRLSRRMDVARQSAQTVLRGAYHLARVKEMAIGGIPAGVGWAYSRLRGGRRGTMVAELRHAPS